MSTDLEKLRRWEESGGTWRVVSRAPGSVTVALLRCDGGEEVDRLISSEPGILTVTLDHEDSEDSVD